MLDRTTAGHSFLDMLVTGKLPDAHEGVGIPPFSPLSEKDKEQLASLERYLLE